MSDFTLGRIQRRRGDWKVTIYYKNLTFSICFDKKTLYPITVSSSSIAWDIKEWVEYPRSELIAFAEKELKEFTQKYKGWK